MLADEVEVMSLEGSGRMFLSDRDIRDAVQGGKIRIEPFVEVQLQPASYDIRLGNDFVLTDDHTTTAVDPCRKKYAKTRKVVIADDEPFVLHPSSSVLAVSKELFGSEHFLIHLGGKSSLARLGLSVHNTAGIINPGHFLNIVFEVTNQHNIPIILRPGMRIAQILFSTLSSVPEKSYGKMGRFARNNQNHFQSDRKTK